MYTHTLTLCTQFSLHIAVCQIPNTMRQQNNTMNTSPRNNAYRHLLRKIIKSLNKEEVDDLCYISTEVNSSGIRNKANFSGIVLFKFFEQRMLITAENLEYLRNHLKTITRIDLCHAIDEYANTYLNGTPIVQFAESRPVSSHVELHQSPTNVGPRPPSYLESHRPPDYHNQCKCMCEYYDVVNCHVTGRCMHVVNMYVTIYVL